MKTKSIILTLAIITSVGCGTNQSYKTNQISQTKQALMNHSLEQDIKWSGIVVQTVKNKNNTCFQLVETEKFSNGNAKYKVIDQDHRFIACKAGDLSQEEYENRLVTVSGDIVAYQKVSEHNMEFPIINADSIIVLNTPNGYDKDYFYTSPQFRGSSSMALKNSYENSGTRASMSNNN